MCFIMNVAHRSIMIYTRIAVVPCIEMTDKNIYLVEQRWNSHPCNVHFARAAAREVVSRFTGDCLEMIELAIGEACANAVEHGSPDGSDNYFTLRCGVVPDRGEIVFEVEDEGYEVSLPRSMMFNLPTDESEGGRGLYLINEIMDDVRVYTSPRGLVVRMTKRIARTSFS